MKSYLTYLSILENLKSKIQPGLQRKNGLDCETGDWLDSAVLKVQKKSWTKNGIGEGIFFSIWAGEKEVGKKRFNYNIHAIKVSQWKEPKIKPGEFASSFRDRFQPFHKSWPNVRVDYGPQTLMQGWTTLNAATFAKDASKLIDEFVQIHGIIDTLLEERKAG